MVGHVEWVDFALVERLPRAGEIVHSRDAWSQTGGGGAGAAVQLANLAGRCDFFTALGDDELGHRAASALQDHGVTVHATFRDEPTRRAFTHVDANGERTITVIGERLEPSGGDPLSWDELAAADSAYFTAGDRAALVAARSARVLVATSRVLAGLSGVYLDALVGSASDPGERYAEGDLDPAPGLVVRTEGERGGTFERGGRTERYEPALLAGPVVDRYGAGDCFAAGLAYALAEGRDSAEAVAFAARCGAAVITGRGPFEAQLRL